MTAGDADLAFADGESFPLHSAKCPSNEDPCPLGSRRVYGSHWVLCPILERQVVALSLHGTHHTRRTRVTCPHSPALLGAGFPWLGAQHTTQQSALSLLFGWGMGQGVQREEAQRNVSLAGSGYCPKSSPSCGESKPDLPSRA